LTFSETQQGLQEKRIRATIEVTDEKGGKATAFQDIVASYTAPPPPPAAPTAIQLSDINYGPNSTRVNNCAKRVLANELYAQMTDARYRDYDVLLIGHHDASEKPAIRGKRNTTLDRERVLNAVAFLSGRGDTCKDIELSRIKVAWVGTQQTDEYKSASATRREGKEDRCWSMPTRPGDRQSKSLYKGATCRRARAAFKRYHAMRCS
jgi:hypothetical protein